MGRSRKGWRPRSPSSCSGRSGLPAVGCVPWTRTRSGANRPQSSCPGGQSRWERHLGKTGPFFSGLVTELGWLTGASCLHHALSQAGCGPAPCGPLIRSALSDSRPRERAYAGAPQAVFPTAVSPRKPFPLRSPSSHRLPPLAAKALGPKPVCGFNAAREICARGRH